MALSINRVTLVGRLGKDPEVRQTNDGVPVANFSVATTKRWTDKHGARQERTTWHKAVVWDRLSDLATQVLFRGSLCYLEGELMNSEYTDKDGVKRYKSEIRVDQLVAMDTAKQREAAGHDGSKVRAEPVTTRDSGWGHDDEPPF